jgi:hypothetical protein
MTFLEDNIPTCFCGSEEITFTKQKMHMDEPERGWDWRAQCESCGRFKIGYTRERAAERLATENP